MSATTHHRRLRKPSGSLSSGSLDGLPEGGLASILVAEYDRKISLLTTQLEEKVEQNITLQQQADTDLGLILDLQDVRLVPPPGPLFPSLAKNSSLC